MNWWLVAILVIVVIIIFKFKDLRHRFGHNLMLLIVVLSILFFAVSFWNIYSSSHIDLTTFDGIVQAGKVYLSWLGNAGGNLLKIGGYAINQNWDINFTNQNVSNFTSSLVNKIK